MSDVKFVWTEDKLELLHNTRSIPVRKAAKIIGCTLGTLAGKRKRLDSPRVENDDWESKLRETWEQRKARRKLEAKQ